MDCSSLAEDEHKTLAEATLLARKSRKRVFEVGYRKRLRDLVADGYVERLGTDHYHLLVECSCEQLKMMRTELRSLSVSSSEQPKLPPQSQSRRWGGATSVGSNEEDVSAVVDGPKGRPRNHTSLRSRDGGETQSVGLPITDSPSRLAGKTISGTRSATEVAELHNRWNSTLGWQDFAVEKWNATHLAGYYDAQTWLRCRGLSSDRYNMKNVVKNMSRLRREGVTNDEIKKMVDLYTSRVASIGNRVPRLWVSFFANVPELRRLLTSNAVGHYNNQPTTSHDDEDYL